MGNAKRIIIFGLFMLLSLLSVRPASAQATAVSGIVRNNVGQPIPGCTVFLVHPVVGRSYPYITDPGGRFFLSNVPLRPDPYYLEIYWGTQLIYRQPFPVNTYFNAAVPFQIFIR